MGTDPSLSAMTSIHAILSFDEDYRESFVVDFATGAFIDVGGEGVFAAVIKGIDRNALTQHGLSEDDSFTGMLLARPVYRRDQAKKYLVKFDPRLGSRGAVMDLLALFRHYKCHWEDKVGAWAESAAAQELRSHRAAGNLRAPD